MTPHAFDFNFVAEENELSVSENLGRPHEHAGGAQNIYEAGIHAGFINLIIHFSFVPSASSEKHHCTAPCSIEMAFSSVQFN